LIEALINGLVTGFLLSWTFGTVFFVLIQTSLEYGWKSGMKIAAGVVFSDLIFILLSLGLLSFIPGLDQNQKIVATIGGVILFGFGISMFFKKQMPLKAPKTKFGNFIYYFTTGIVLNGINPVNFISWLVVSRTIYPVVNHSILENVIFYTAVLGTIFGCESLISFSAHKLKRFFTTSLLKKIDYLMGIIFICIGIYMIYIYNFTNEIPIQH
jgi:L-lysine exporter family protein LysE/ArgO